ncbi:MAG TPA: low specificity L-threonine aldolase [Phycisphaerae bacterium]|jgi:threonine aldolase
MPPRNFTSDNQAGVCPAAWQALLQANSVPHTPSYGDDPWTQRAADKLRELFQTDECEVFFCFNGTAANALTIAHLVESYSSILCHEAAHIETDECGAPEFFSNGAKILTTSGSHGKLTPDALSTLISKRNDVHYPRPRLLSITQATEWGTLYSPREIQGLTQIAKSAGLYVHMDGARFANAIATLNVPPAQITWQAGVDVLCFGGTKNGLLVGDAILFFNRSLAADFDRRCKQAGQLASKMRFLSAPWFHMLDTGTWLSNARHANAMAAELASRLQAIPGILILHPSQANSVFLQLPLALASALKSRGWNFYTFIGGGARFMTAWDTSQEDIDQLIGDFQELSINSPL